MKFLITSLSPFSSGKDSGCRASILLTSDVIGGDVLNVLSDWLKLKLRVG